MKGSSGKVVLSPKPNSETVITYEKLVSISGAVGDLLLTSQWNTQCNWGELTVQEQQG